MELLMLWLLQYHWNIHLQLYNCQNPSTVDNWVWMLQYENLILVKNFLHLVWNFHFLFTYFHFSFFAVILFTFRSFLCLPRLPVVWGLLLPHETCFPSSWSGHYSNTRWSARLPSSSEHISFSLAPLSYPLSLYTLDTFWWHGEYLPLLPFFNFL